MQMKLPKKFLNHFFLDIKIRLKISMKGKEFFFDGVNLLYYICHKINFKRGGSYIDSPDWIKKSDN